MIPAFSVLLAWRQLVTRSVTIFGTVGVAVSVAAMIIVVSILSGFVGGWRDLLRGATPQLLIQGLPEGTSYTKVRELLEGDPAVASMAPRLVHQGILRPRGVTGSRIRSTEGLEAQPLAHDFVQLVGVDPEAEARTTSFRDWVGKPYSTERRVHDLDRPFFVPAARRRNAPGNRDAMGGGNGLVSRRAQWFDGRGVLIGDSRLSRSRPMMPGQEVEIFSVHLQPTTEDRETPIADRIGEIRKILPLAGGFRTGFQETDAIRAFIHIDDLREMLDVDLFADDADRVHEVAIRLVAGSDLAAEAKRLGDLCRDKFGSARPSTWRDIHEVFLSAVEQERANIRLAMIATLPVAAFLIYVTLTMLVMQKRRDIGILLAMGASPRGILAMFLLGGLVIAGVGSSVGSAVGSLSILYINEIDDFAERTIGIEMFPSAIYGSQAIPAVLSPVWVAQVVAGAFAIAMTAVLLPALRAARMEPVQTLAHE